jgi:diaminohydroxyphosphoribosylaminopyrimidine deaminase / 5-amino-6-(5-phosphoribosylamino)uracil reductase
VERTNPELTALDRLYLQRAYELAARGIGNTAPNPPVGALVVRDGRIVGEGYHHRAGGPHAEVNALAQAGAAARDATLYLSLEPCRHVGRTPPCVRAVAEAGVARIVAGTLDPTEHGGAAELRAAGVEVKIAGDAAARELIEAFARAAGGERPYVALKMAMSVDGKVASRPGAREQIGSPEEVAFVRNLRTAYDAVMVGAGTIRVDDPELTVRPPHDRIRPYTRIVACAQYPLDGARRIFTRPHGYAKTIVLVPAGLRGQFDNLRELAEVLPIGPAGATTLDLRLAMDALRKRDITSVLCEGGPHLAASLLASEVVDRIFWAIAPRFLGCEGAVSVLAPADLGKLRVRVDRIERAGPDVVLSGAVCSAA